MSRLKILIYCHITDLQRYAPTSCDLVPLEITSNICHQLFPNFNAHTSKKKFWITTFYNVYSTTFGQCQCCMGTSFQIIKKASLSMATFMEFLFVENIKCSFTSKWFLKIEWVVGWKHTTPHVLSAKKKVQKSTNFVLFLEKKCRVWFLGYMHMFLFNFNS